MLDQGAVNPATREEELEWSRGTQEKQTVYMWWSWEKGERTEVTNTIVEISLILQTAA